MYCQASSSQFNQSLNLPRCQLAGKEAQASNSLETTYYILFEHPYLTYRFLDIKKSVLNIADSLNEFTFQSKATKSTTQTKKETEQKIDETPATEKKNSIDDVNEIEIEKMSLNQNKEESELKIKGQKISEGNCGVSNSPQKAIKSFP